MDAKVERFTEYLRPQWRRLQGVARNLVAAAEDAHDLVQETLLRAWSGFSAADERTYSRAWLFIIMRNVALEWHRTASRRIRIVAGDPELTELAAAEPDEPLCPLPALDERQFREYLDDRLAAALDSLDPGFYEIIVLSVIAGLRYREIAEVLDCPVGTVMSRMARARRALRERLADPTPARPGRRGVGP